MINSLGESLQGFFKYCEEKNQSSAKDLSSLFAEYFSLPECSPAPAKKVAVTKKVAAPKASKSGPLPREQQTVVMRSYIESKDAKLPELKKLAGERGVSKTGNKATIVQNILAYEESFGKIDEDPRDEDTLDEDDPKIAIQKPKIRKEGLSRPVTKHKVKVEKKHNLSVVHNNELNGYFVLDDENVAIGWIDEEDSEEGGEDEEVEIRALEEKHCEEAKKIGLEYTPSDNLDL
jgi:hypothetical protein